MLRWCAALMQCAKLTVRGKQKDISSLTETLSVNEFAKLSNIKSSTRWLYCIQQIEEVWAEGLDLNVLHKVMADMMREDVSGLRSNIGAMLRISSTPMQYAAYGMRTWFI